MHLLIWTLTAAVLGLWSLAAWGLATLLGLDPTWVGDLQPWLERVPFAAVLDQWFAGWQALLMAALGLTQVLLGWAGSAGLWVVGLLWALGAALIVGAGAVLSLLVVLARKATAAQPPQSAAA